MQARSRRDIFFNRHNIVQYIAPIVVQYVEVIMALRSSFCKGGSLKLRSDPRTRASLSYIFADSLNVNGSATQSMTRSTCTVAS